MKVGLYFGSFNPIHNGHLIIAQYFAEFTDLDEVWLVVTPQNPLKTSTGLLADHHRYEMARLAVDGYSRIKVSNIEFGLPKPSYTIDTLTYLSERYPEKSFVLLMGSDNLISINKWKNWEQLLSAYDIMVYPRPGYEDVALEKEKLKRTTTVKGVPLMQISSTFIRSAIKNKKDIRFMLPESVYHYIDEMNLYKK